MTRCLFLALPLVALTHCPAWADEPLSFAAGAKVQVACTTSAVDLRTETLTTSEGTVRLHLSRSQDPSTDGNTQQLTWHVDVDQQHAASFAAHTTCTPCTFTLDEQKPLATLWSPRPLALTQNPDGATLLVVTLDLKTLELKASQFQGKELAGLERGTCTRAEPPTAASAAPAGPPKPSEPPAAPKESEKP